MALHDIYARPDSGAMHLEAHFGWNAMLERSETAPEVEEDLVRSDRLLVAGR